MPRTRVGRTILVLVVLVHGLALYEARRPLVAATGQCGCHTTDCDTELILADLARVHAPGDTLRWWTGHWMGDFAMWRPLSSYLFLAQYRLWGDSPWRFTCVSVLLCGLLAGAVAWGLEPLLGLRWSCVLALYLFVRLPMPWPHLVPLARMMQYWKNQPDLTAGAALFVSLGLLMRGRTVGALLAAVVACAFKEIGFVTFALGPLVLAGQRRALPPWRATLAVVATGAALFVGRYALVGLGWRMGTNLQWSHRLWIFCAQPYLTEFACRWWAPTLATEVWLALRLGRRRPWLALCGLAVAVVLTTAIGAARVGEPWPHLLVWYADTFKLTVGLVVWLELARLALRHEPWLVGVGLAWMVLGVLPTFVSAHVTEHARWLGLCGRGVVVLAAWRAALTELRLRPVLRGWYAGRVRREHAATD